MSLLSSAGWKRWSGTYGVFALVVAFAGAFLVYHRIHRQGAHNAALARELQAALAAMEGDPAGAALRLEGVLAKSSSSQITPWMRLALGAAWHRKGRSLGPEAQRDLARPYLQKAVGAYVQVFRFSPGHPAAPQALYAAAQIREDLRQDLNAVEYYAELFTRYPGSLQAQWVDERFLVTQAMKEDKEEGKEQPRDPLEIVRSRLQNLRIRYQEALAALDSKEREKEEKKDEEKEPQSPQ